MNPSCIKEFRRSENIGNKDDAIDAGLIARYCAAMKPAPWVPPPLEQRQLRDWPLRVQPLKDIRQQEENRREVHLVSGMDDVAAHAAEYVKWIDGEIRKLEKEIEGNIDRHPGLTRDAALITTISGIGPTTIARIPGHLGDIRSFKNAEALAAFLGVTPRHHTSGTSIKERSIVCRTGSTSLRAAPFMPSMVGCRFNRILNQFAAR